MEGHIQVQGQPIYGHNQNQHGGAIPGGRGQGETVPVPPIPRRRLSKIRNNGDESSSGQTDGGSDCQTTTIHVTSIGVEDQLRHEQQQQEQQQQPRNQNVQSSRENSRSGKSWTKMFFYSSAAFLVCFIVVGMTLDYLDLWDPCVVHIPYEKHCTTDSYAGGLFYRTDYREESLCLIPGVFYSTKTTGWNTDGICSNDQDVSTSSPSPSPCIGTDESI